MNITRYTPPLTIEIETATLNLLTAILRYPLQLPDQRQSIDAVRLGHCKQYGVPILEALRQYDEIGHYSIASVQRAVKSDANEAINLMQVASNHLDSDLGFYVEVWNDEYIKFALNESYLVALTELQQTGSPELSKQTFSQVSEFLRLDANIERSEWREQFSEETDRKIQGIKNDTKTKNTIPEWKNVIPEFENSLLYIIAARPSMGKTALVMDLVKGFETQGANVCIYTLEMSGAQMARRILAREARINPRADWSVLSEDRKRIIREKKEYIKSAKYDFMCNVNLPQLIADARQRHKRGELDVIIVDHIGLLDTENPRHNDTQRITEITKRLKKLAMSLGIPVIALSQLSRSVETRGGSKRPMLSDLRDSGSVEQDADAVTFIYRAEYYGITEDEQGRSLVGIAELITAKQRDGATDVSILGYHPILGFCFTEDEMRNGEQAKLIAFKSTQYNTSNELENTASLIETEPQEYSQTQTQYKQNRSDADVPF